MEVQAQDCGQTQKKSGKTVYRFWGMDIIRKNLDRVKGSLFDYPIISTNLRYLKEIRRHLKKSKINKYKIILEPSKKNTAPAILATALIDDIPEKQPMIFLSADHLIKKVGKFNKEIKRNKSF